MKDYKEMTESVLQQAKIRVAQQRSQRRMATGLIAATLCLGILVAVVGVGTNRDPAGPTQPTLSMQNPTTVPATKPDATEPTQPENIVQTGNVYFLSATKDTAELAPMQANMTLPWDHMIRVRSLKGMTEEQKRQARSEEIAMMHAFSAKYLGLIGEGRYAYYEDEDTIIHHWSAGRASVILMNGSNVKSVDCESLGVLEVGRGTSNLTKDYTIGKGEYAVTIPANSMRITLNCKMSETTRKHFEENPETPLSTIRDTITLTIHYKDGTIEIVVIDVTVDDDGQIYMTQRGDNTGA